MFSRLPHLILLCLMPVRAICGPDATTQFLLDDSASMLDFGLLRLDILLSEKQLGTAQFLWDGNIFLISTILTGNETHELAEAACSQWVKDVRIAALVNGATGEPLYKNSTFAPYFDHNGFARNARPENLLQEIDKKFLLKCFSFFQGYEKTTISAPLLGTGYSVEK